MNVKIINPEVLQNLYKNHGEFACECYATPKKFAEKVGKSCEADGHMSGSRCEYIKFEIEADRGTLEQMMRSEIGVRYDNQDKYYYMDLIEAIPRVSPDEIVKNMQSFRYVDKNDFTYVVPHNIEKNEKGAQNVIAMLYTSETAASRRISDSKTTSEGEQYAAILATKITENQEILNDGEAGLMCECSADGMVEVLSQILDGSFSIPMLEAKSAKLAAQFDIDEILYKIESILQEVIT